MANRRVRLSTLKKPHISALFLLPLIIFSFNFLENNFLRYTRGHSSTSEPKELYSLWNDTNIIIDGKVDFNSSSMAAEWSSAAVHYLYDKNGAYNSRLLIKNDNSYLTIGLDATSFTTENPESVWGAAIYIDRDHNGFLSSMDRAIMIKSNSSSYVLYMSYNTILNDWIEIESGTLGVVLSSSGIIANTQYESSFFNIDQHHQFEFKIPLNILSIVPGKYIGMGFEIFIDEQFLDDEITWPFVPSQPSLIRRNAGYFGDVYLGESINYSLLSIENNFNIKEGAVGENNGTFLSIGDINGDGDKELVVVSNRTVPFDTNLIAIYDFIDGELTKIWSSWMSALSSELFFIQGVVCYDFDGDGKDELYGVGSDSRILRIHNWNAITNDFEQADIAFAHSTSLMGYIALGDANNDGQMNLIVGDQSGYIIVLEYNLQGNTFGHELRSPFRPSVDPPTPAARIHALAVADMDADGKEEILAILQTTTNNALSPTELNIFERGVAKYNTNNEDNLPVYSSISTLDNFGHTIIVDDVDNDDEMETIIVGQHYLKIFGLYSYDTPTPPLEFLINDGTSPQMGGGAIVDDFDQDGYKELIFGCNNGTIFIMRIIDEGGDTFSYSIKWTADIGSSPGKQNSILPFDIDNDNEKEIIVSDNYGQIFILGKTAPPVVHITSPVSGYTTSKSKIKVTWEGHDDIYIHHFDIEVEGSFVAKLSGSQTSFLVPIFSITNLIKITAVDISGKNSSDIITIGYNAFAPEVFITSPMNYFLTQDSTVLLEFYHDDPNENFLYYNIYLNNTKIEEEYSEDYYYLFLPFEGTFDITIEAVDDTDFKGKNVVFITYDSSPPTIDMIYPTGLVYTKLSFFEIRWASEDSYSGVSHFDIYIDKLYITSTSNQRITLELNVDRSYNIEIVAFDFIGNHQNVSVTIIKDSIKPNVAITSHQSRTILSENSIHLTWIANDNIGGSGIQYSKVIVNKEAKYFGTSQSTIITFTTEGIKDIEVITYDKAGNSRSDFISIIIDTTAPLIEILTPTDNYTTGLDFIPLSWNAFDYGSGIKEIQIFIDDILNNTITDLFIRSISLSIPTDKTSEIKVVAIDYLNRSSMDSITVRQNSSYESFLVTTPIANVTYYSTTQILLEWEIANIHNIIEIVIMVNETEIFSTTNASLLTYILDLGAIPIDSYPLYNITIIVRTLNVDYVEARWIIIDQNNPFVTIITPTNDAYITSQSSIIEWSSYDPGVGIEKYILKINSNIQFVTFIGKSSYLMAFELGDGVYSLEMIVYDKANNSASHSIAINVQLLLPEVALNISSIYYTKTGEFALNFSITNPEVGVLKYQINLDGEEQIVTYAYPELITTPYSRIITFQSSNYTTLYGDHILSVIIVDAFYREKINDYIIIVDNLPPEVIGSLALNGKLASDTITIKKFENSNENNHTFSITIRDNYAINKVFLAINNLEHLFIKEMISMQSTKSEIATFFVIIDFSTIPNGNYQLTIEAIDFAGNTITIFYNLNVVAAQSVPWFLQGDNIYYFTIVLLTLLILLSFLIVGLRKHIQNKHWQDEIVAVFYIKSTGLTILSETYIPDIIKDEEQLVGGAMIAIQGLLEEIRGSKKRGIQKMDVGNYTLLLFIGQYGLGALIVHLHKPKHKKQISDFTQIFEQRYKKPLEDLYVVDSTLFVGSTKLVEKFFGLLPSDSITLEKEALAKQLENYQRIQQQEEPHIRKEPSNEISNEIAPIDNLFSELSKEAKNQLTKVLKIIPQIIIQIADLNFDNAEKKAIDVVNYTEIILKLERGNKELNYFVQEVISLIKDIFKAIEEGRKGNITEARRIIEITSNLWFKEIAEKWSDVL